MRRALLLLLLLLPLTLMAAEPTYRFETETQAARFKSLSEQLRCLVCQGQNIAGSDADLAKDLREQVRTQILKGRTDREIKDYMVARYGDFVLFKPPVKASTWLLWLSPFALLLGGAGTILALMRRRAPAPLSEEERARVRALLNEVER